jgi:hypothetical protein
VIAAAFVTNAFLYIVCFLIQKYKNKISFSLKQRIGYSISFIIAPVLSTLLLFFCTLFVRHFSYPDSNIGLLGSLSALLAICLLVLTVSQKMLNKKVFSIVEGEIHKPKKLGKVIMLCSISVLVLFLVEIFVCNWEQYRIVQNHLSTETLSLAQAKVTNGSINKNGNIQCGSGEVDIEFDNLAKKTDSLYLQMSGKYGLYNGTAEIQDDYNTYGYVGACNFDYVLYNNNAVSAAEIRLASRGNMRGFKLVFKNSSGFVINNITLNRTRGFVFQFPRFLLLSLLCILVSIIKCFNLVSVVYDRRKKIHKVAIAGALILCIALSTTILFASTPKGDRGLIAYTPKKDVTTMFDLNDWYAQQFDAFQKGQLNLDATPDQRLVSAANPYDSSLRDHFGIYWWADHAYYNGKYYSYFGVAPVIYIYYPIYFVTHEIPTRGLVSYLCTVLAILAIFGAMLELIRRYCKRVNLLLLVFGILAVVFVSPVIDMQTLNSAYTTCILSAILGLASMVYFSYRAYRSEKRLPRTLLLILDGISSILVIASKPTIILVGVALILPLLCSILFEKQRPFGSKAADVISFIIPTIVGGMLVMLYNYLRFDSPTQFGAIYQLTTNDISQNKIAFDKFFASIYHYFFENLDFSLTFPFVSFSSENLGNYGNFEFVQPCAGVFAFPLCWGLFMMRPAMKQNKDLVKRITAWSVIVSAILLAFIDFCIAGLSFRYVADIFFVLGALSLIFLLDINNISIQPCKNMHARLIYSLTMTALVSTIVIEFFLLFKNEGHTIADNSPIIYHYLEKMFFY